MAEISASYLEEGSNYIYQKSAGPKREVTILSAVKDVRSNTYYLRFKYPGSSGTFDAVIQDGRRPDGVHHFYELPEEAPSELEAGPADVTISEDPATGKDEDPKGGKKRRRRKTSKRKSRRHSRKRRTLKK